MATGNYSRCHAFFLFRHVHSGQTRPPRRACICGSLLVWPKPTSNKLMDVGLTILEKDDLYESFRSDLARRRFHALPNQVGTPDSSHELGIRAKHLRSNNKEFIELSLCWALLPIGEFRHERPAERPWSSLVTAFYECTASTRAKGQARVIPRFQL